ncbi:hypothetical protein ACFYNX_26230 [Streptomyces sp. NPDC007872]|uniref:competence protein CoiA family protein n=1 Tax=Streptomyces sp. NPDC007872 TaxID=3364782 RepID=UPI00369FF9AA
MSAKELLARWVAGEPTLRGWRVHVDDTPITMPDGLRRPDILAISPDGAARVAFEVQYSELTGEQWRARHSFYARAGVVDIWLFAHHGPQWRTRAVTGPARQTELAHHDPRWTAAVGLSGLHQAMLQDGVTPLWLDPTARTVGTATARFAPAAPPRRRPSRLVRDPALYVLPPQQDFRACYLEADPLEECRIDLAGGELLTPARARQRLEHERLLGDQEEARERLAALQEQRSRDNDVRRQQEQQRRREKAQAYAAEQEEAQRQADLRARQEQQRRDEERAAAQDRQVVPPLDQYPRLFDVGPAPAPRRRGWWRIRRRRQR